MRFWLSRGEGEVIGPFTIAELEAMAARGELVGPGGVMPQVCPEGDAVWRPVSMIPELADLMGRLLASGAGAASAGAASALPRIGAASPALWPPPRVPGTDPLQGIGFTFEQVFGLGWRTLQSNYLLLLGATAVTLGVSLAGSLSIAVIDAMALRSGGTAAIALRVISALLNLGFNLLVNLPITLGSIWLVVPIVRGEPARFAELLAPYRRLLHLIATSLLMGVLLLASAFVGILVVVGGAAWASGTRGSAGGVATLVLGVVLMLVPVVLLSARLAPAYLLVLDPRASPQGPLGPLQALAEAWRITRGRMWTVVGIGLVIGLIALFSVLACFLPWIFLGNPLSLAVYGAAYAVLLHTAAGVAPPVLRSGP